MQNQACLRLSLPRNLRESASAHRSNEQILQIAIQTGKRFNHVPAEKLLADLLKRQARRAMCDATECDAAFMGVQLSRIRDLAELFEHFLKNDFRETAEACLSGRQLAYPHTLADFLACLDLTRQNHRAPIFVNSRDTDIADCKKMFNTIAGLLSTHPLIEEITELSGGGL